MMSKPSRLWAVTDRPYNTDASVTSRPANKSSIPRTSRSCPEKCCRHSLEHQEVQRGEVRLESLMVRLRGSGCGIHVPPKRRTPVMERWNREAGDRRVRPHNYR